MGGKISSVSSFETAYYPRDCKFFVDIFNFWDTPVDQEKNMKWNGKTFQSLYSDLGPYVYLGFPISTLTDPLNSYYGKNKDKLLSIKHRIDPLNIMGIMYTHTIS